MNKRAKSKERKSLQELTIKDNFMFGAVMLNPEICRETLERILGIEIARVEVSKEKSIVYNPEYKGVRLDIYAKDENNTHYDVEMQALRHSAIEKRARYYHGQIDMEVLLSGVSYTNLPDTYVIFICDFDPLGRKKYRYTQKKICREDPQLSMDDGAHTIFLSTVGTNEDEVSPDLVRFLKYVGTPLSDSEKDFDDAFIQRIQSAVKEVKAGKIDFKVDKTGIIHTAIGKASFTPEQIYDNAKTVLSAIVKLKPQTLKGTYLKGAAICTTMSPGVTIDIKAFSAE